MSSRTNEGIVPTLEEIQAYKERPPILATIELVNGALLTEDLPVAPDLNVKKVGAEGGGGRCLVWVLRGLVRPGTLLFFWESCVQSRRDYPFEVLVFGKKTAIQRDFGPFWGGDRGVRPSVLRCLVLRIETRRGERAINSKNKWP